ncbi:C4-dicarboxylate ABC transporter [Rhodococcus sp. HNM0569]|nr:C4-dicarboxylate ABC transporter [Rhodococcus sp. HNM0569]
MGTGVIAVAAGPSHTEQVIGRVAAVASGAVLVVLLVGYARRWITTPASALADIVDDAEFPFHGAIAMGVLAVGAAVRIHFDALLVPAVGMWFVGTLLGLATFTEAIRRRARHVSDAPPTVLLAVVPPMVSAATGAALVPHTSGFARDVLACACWTQVAAVAVGVFAVGRGVLTRLRRSGLPDPAARPTLWIPLGVLGQSIAAVSLLGAVAWPGVHLAAVGYGVVVGTLAAAAIAALTYVTLTTFAGGLPFSPSWWSFTFPLGTCAVGAHAFGSTTGTAVPHAVGSAVWIALCGMWLTAASATAWWLVRGLGGKAPVKNPMGEKGRTGTFDRAAVFDQTAAFEGAGADSGAPASTGRPD